MFDMNLSLKILIVNIFFKKIIIFCDNLSKTFINKAKLVILNIAKHNKGATLCENLEKDLDIYDKNKV